MSSQHLRIAMKIRGSSLVLVTALLAATAFGLTGCSLGKGEMPPSPGPLKLSLPNQECLKTSIPTIQHFFQGTAAEQDLNESWGCFSNALRMFSTSTRGADPNFYTSRELRTFLETFFLGDIKITDQLLTEVMRFKQMLVGGPIDRLTRAELVQAQNILEVLRVETQRLRPYMTLITLQESSDDALRASSRVPDAIVALQTTSDTLGTLFGRGSEQYDTESFENLLNELKPLFKNWNGPTKALTYLPTFQVLKTLLLNPAGNRITPAEWQPLLANAGHLYALYLRMHYLMAGQDLMTGDGLKQLSATYEDLYTLLRGGIMAKVAKMITYPQIDDAINEMYRVGLLDDSIRDTTVKGLVRIMTQKLLNPKSKGTRPVVKGLNLDVFDRLHAQGQAFLDMQRVWGDVAAQAVAQDPKYKTSAIPMPLMRQLWPQISSSYAVAKEDLRQLFEQTSPLSFRDNGTVIFDNRLSHVSLTKKSFTNYNVISVAIRMILNGYTSDAVTNRYTGVNQDQLHSMFTDIHELAVDLRVLEPKDDQLWQTSFNESNMFMLSADANDHVSYFEAFDFLSYMLGGGHMSTRLFEDIKEKCSHIGEDAFARPTMDVACFRERNQALFATTYVELPSWVKTANDVGPEKFPQIQSLLEAATRVGGVSDNPVSFSDVTRMTMVMQYIESIFVRFDADRSGTLNYDEAKAAFPLFKDVLNTASHFNNDRKNMALFYYLLAYGKPPTSLSDKLYFQFIWLSSESRWRRVQADRVKILEIVAALKSSINK